MIKKYYSHSSLFLQLLVDLSFSTGVMFNIIQIKATFPLFLLLPAIITLVILSPWLIYSVYKSYKEKERAGCKSKSR